MIEQLAVWYLKRRGRMVMPRLFVGFVVGFGTASKLATTDHHDVWEVIVPKNCPFIAMNNSVVSTDGKGVQ